MFEKIGRFILYVISAIIVIAGVTFAYLNAVNVSLNYYFGVVSIPLSMLLLLTMGVGIIIGAIFVIPVHVKLSAANRKIKRLTKNDVN